MRDAHEIPPYVSCSTRLSLFLALAFGLVAFIPGQPAGAGDQAHPSPAAERRNHPEPSLRETTLLPWQRHMRNLRGRGAIAFGSPHGRAPLQGSAGTDGDWSHVSISGRSGLTSIYDPLRDRMVVFGGGDWANSLNDVWALSMSGSPPWTQLTPTGTPPTGRYGSTAIYDPVRDRMVVFGGYDGTYRNDVWALSLSGDPGWSEVAPSATPPTGRAAHAAIYDPVRDRIVVFGGYDGSYRNDVWALSLAGTPTWTELTLGVPPDARGKVPTVATVAGARPSSRYGHSAIYDPVHNRMVVFGGEDSTYPDRNDVWALSLSGTPRWTELTPTGTPPSGRIRHTAVYDPLRNRMVVFGGGDYTYGHDTWELSLSGNPAWTQLWPEGTLPAGRVAHTAIYDPVRDRMVVFGGEDDVYYPDRNDVWALSMSGRLAWTPVTGTSPSPRSGHTAIYDPLRDRMVVFGGYTWPPSYYDDVWGLSFSGSPSWTGLAPAGTPSGRYGHTAIYDPVRDRMVVFGGRGEWSGVLNDVWALSLSGSPAWTEVTPAGEPPPARQEHTAIYDPVRDRVVVFAGRDFSSEYNDVWALSLSGSPAWTQLIPTGTPPAARHLHTALYDPVRDRMVVFGGASPYGNDVWALSLSGSPAWTELTPAGTPPTGRFGHSAIYDPVRDRMVIFAGHDTSENADAWALSLYGTPAWTELTPGGTLPPPRAWHTAVHDPLRDRMVVFGGGDFYVEFNDTWALQWVTSTGVQPLPTRFVDALHPCYPNPFNPRVTIPFELREDGSATLSVYDVAGRLVKTVLNEWTPRGVHTASWDGRSESGGQVSSGVYFCRLRTDGFAETRKIVMLK